MSMNFQVKSFATIRLCVSDVEGCGNWCGAFFGVKPIEDLEGFISFKIGETTLDICIADAKSPESSGGSIGYWLVDDLNKAVEKAKTLGGKVYRGPLRVEEVKRTIVQIMTPYGGVVGLEEEY